MWTRDVAHPMFATVNLLLLLSALLSALAGIGGSARQPQVAQALAQPLRQTIVTAAQHAHATRPVQSRPTLFASAAAPMARILALAALEPVYSGRRRE